jgi:V/A-type H+-transporting ATPase subunit A
MEITGTIERINGSLILANFSEKPKIGDLVEIGELKLMGEIVRLTENIAAIQCYESTSGLKPGEPVRDGGKPLVAELGPGLIGTIFDGVQRSELELWNITGPFISRGVSILPLDTKKQWNFIPKVKNGEKVNEGDVIGTVRETASIEHRILVPVGWKGTITDISEGKFTVTEPVATLDTSGDKKDFVMMQTWPVRLPRPFRERIPLTMPLITGQRVIDTFFPVAKGGAACIPGGFGTGKTVALQQIAKWADADIIIYIGCGERGNEMADVVTHFPEIVDPKTGSKLIERTIIIANVSNMPVSAREASMYMGITMAEYFRDQGYDVAVMADSTSRWAEALRDLSGRLEEIPAESGFPAYLADRIAEMYERAGRVYTLGRDERIGSVTTLGAVSPPGSDFSEPVTTHTLRFVGTFWALDQELAFRRHFPAINWLRSFTRYLSLAAKWWSKFDPTWEQLRARALGLLEDASEIEETARIIGEKALPDEQRLILLLSEMIREGFLVQSAYHEVDTYCDAEKQAKLLRAIMDFYDATVPLVSRGIPIEQIREMKVISEIMRLKERKGTAEIDKVKGEMLAQIGDLAKKYEGVKE